jgi:hypothetical protein
MTDEAGRPPNPPPPTPAVPVQPAKESKGCLFYGFLVACILVLVVVLTSFLTVLWVRHNTHADAFEPVVLTQQEQQVFEEKVRILSPRDGDDEREARPPPRESPDFVIPVEPEAEPEEEDFIRKPVVITEREINALFGSHAELAETVYITLRKDTIQLKVNHPVTVDVPVLGGKTIRLNVRAGLQYHDGVLDVRIRNVAVGGVPVPNAWLGGMKNVNLVEEFAGDDEVIRALAAGIETLEVQDGQIVFVPAE